jgi:WD40-like Beta Propeller Repeat
MKKSLIFTLTLASSTVFAQKNVKTATTNEVKKTASVATVVTAKSPEQPKKTDTMPAGTKKPNGKVEIHNAKLLNGTKDDFSPMLFENGILYCSNSRKVKNEDDKVPDDLNLKFAAFDSLGKVTRPSSFSRRTNSKTHEGPSCFNEKGDTMFLTRNMSKGGVDIKSKNGKFTLKIYMKVKDSTGAFVGDKKWPFELENYSYCHPTLSKDGKRLYFASDMPGGFGGMDLYMIRKINDSTWTSPINLGARINTTLNEVFPYFAPDNKLYFASNGQRGGKGGLDIYSIDIDNRAGMSVPMEAPFNTEFDDFGIMFTLKDRTKGFFSSNRVGGAGGDDIYEFDYKE